MTNDDGQLMHFSFRSITSFDDCLTVDDIIVSTSLLKEQKKTRKKPHSDPINDSKRADKRKKLLNMKMK